MSFAHTCMCLVTFVSEHLCTYDAMTYIGCFTETIYAWSVTFDDADVMKHSGFFHKSSVSMQLGVCIDNLECFTAHLFTMREQDATHFHIFVVILVDDRLIIHTL